MKCDIEGNIVVARLYDGEDLFTEIERILQGYEIDSGIVVSSIGMLKDFEIGYFDGKEYLKERYAEPHELIALHGSIAMMKKKPSIHLHCGLANREHRLIGGHLFSAKVCVLNELALLKLGDMKLTRKLNRKSGLTELDIETD